MKLIILAFILSLTLHFLFFYPSKEKEEIIEPQKTTKKINKSSVKYVKLLKKEQKAQVQKKKTGKIKKVVKKIDKKSFTKVEKKKIIPQKKNKVIKKPKKTVKKILKRTTKKPIKRLKKEIEYTKSVQIKPQEKRKTISKKSLENFLLSDPVPLDMDMLDEITRSYLKAYGKEYDSFTKVQKVFLQNNLKKFTRITQRVLNRLGYPPLAAKLRLSGINFVEFIFHPNGDISDLRITTSSGYKVFDKYTLELIEIAYKEYPRPKEATKIKFRVIYNSY